MSEPHRQPNVNSIGHGAIEPVATVEAPQVTVQTSALVDDFGAMSYEIYDVSVSLFFGNKDDNIHVAFTDQSLLNLARLVNQAVCAMLRARGIPVPTWVGQQHSEA